MALSEKIRAALASYYADEPELAHSVHARFLLEGVGSIDAYEIWVGNRRAQLSGMDVCRLLEARTLPETLEGLLRRPAPFDEVQENPLIKESALLRQLLIEVWPIQDPHICAVWGLALQANFPEIEEGAFLTIGQHGVIVRAIKNFLALVFAASESAIKAMLEGAQIRILKEKAS